MKIYVGHAKSFDFENELYLPIKNSSLSKDHQIILPHEKGATPFPSKELFKTGCDLMIAEVSQPSTGLGIEIGWADVLNVPIVCVYRKGAKIAGSLKIITQDFIEYDSPLELPDLLLGFLEK